MPIPTPLQNAHLEWSISPSQGIIPNIQQYIRQVLYGSLEDRMRQRAQQIEMWMKANAAWEDDTGNARAGLYAEIEATYESGIVLSMGYSGIDYSLWLEVMQAGRFSILGPTIDVWLPVIERDIQQIVGGR